MDAKWVPNIREPSIVFIQRHGFPEIWQKNLLEVTVAKESENASVNLAERRADYWNFGGIFRPVFLEVKPAVNLRHIAIDAKMDGTFRANCYTNISNDGMSIRTQILDKKGKDNGNHRTRKSRRRLDFPATECI